MGKDFYGQRSLSEVKCRSEWREPAWVHFSLFVCSSSEVVWKSDRHGTLGERGTTRTDGMQSVTRTPWATDNMAEGRRTTVAESYPGHPTTAGRTHSTVPVSECCAQRHIHVYTWEQGRTRSATIYAQCPRFGLHTVSLSFTFQSPFDLVALFLSHFFCCNKPVFQFMPTVFPVHPLN